MTEITPDSPTPRSRGGQLVINVMANYGYFVVGLGVMFLLSPFLNNHLGKKTFGDWLFLIGLTQYFSLADAGLNAATVKFVSQHLARKEWDRLEQVMIASLRFFLGLGLLFAFVGIAVWAAPSTLGFPDAILGKLKEMPPETGLTVLFIIFLNWAVELGFAPFNAALFGAQRYDLARSMAIVARLAKFAAILILISAGHGVVILALVTLGEAFLRGVLEWILARRCLPEIPFRLAGAVGDTYQVFIRFSVWILISNLAYKLLLMTDNVLVQLTRQEAEVVLYNTTMTPILTMEQLLWALAQVLVPFAAAGAARAEGRTLRETVLRGSRITLLMALPMITYLALAGRGFIGAWMFHAEEFPLEDVVQSHSLLLVLAPAFLLMFLLQPSIAVLVGMGRIRVPAFLNLGQGIAKIVLSLLLVGPLGLMGIALGTVIPLVIANVILLPWYVNRVIGIRWRDLLKEAVLPGLATLAVAGPLAFAFLTLVQAGEEPLWRLRFQIPIALGVAVLFLAASWFLGLSREDRDWVRARWPFKKKGSDSGTH